MGHLKTTNIIILLCIAVSLFSWFINPKMASRFFVFRAADFFRGEVWTPVTALFVHANLVHLIGNMIFLYVFGNTMEDALGAKEMATAFFVGGVCSFIFSVPFYGLDVSMVGASAAIFTLTATVMLIKPLKFSWLFLMPLGLVAILYFLYNLLAVYYMTQGAVSYAGHAIGFLIGVPFGIAWSRRKWVMNLLITILLLILYVVLTFTIEHFFGLLR